MPEQESVNQAALDKLQKMGGDRFVRQMISLFVDFGGQKVKEARSALDGSNIQGVEKCVHAIKSSAMNLGAQRVWEIASEMEELTKDGLTESLPELLTGLENEFALAKAALEKKADELG